jgi:hypothetical protein
VNEPLIPGIIEEQIVTCEGCELARLRDDLSGTKLVAFDLKDIDFRCAATDVHGRPWMIFSRTSACTG